MLVGCKRPIKDKSISGPVCLHPSCAGRCRTCQNLAHVTFDDVHCICIRGIFPAVQGTNHLRTTSFRHACQKGLKMLVTVRHVPMTHEALARQT